MPEDGFTHTITIRPTPKELLGEREKSDNQLIVGLSPFIHVEIDELVHFMVFDRLSGYRDDKRSSDIVSAQYLGVHNDTMVFSASYPREKEVEKSAQAVGGRVNKYLGRFGLKAEIKLELDEQDPGIP